MTGPLTIRAFARELHIGRNQAAALVRRRVVATIPWGASRRIPASEVRRIAEEGFTPPGARRAPRRSPRSGTIDPEALRSLDLEAL